MFGGKNKETEKKTVTERNVVAKNTVIVGDIKSDGDFRIDGTLEGTLKTNGRVIIGVNGLIKGKIEAEYADIEGKFIGELLVLNTLTVKASANISGDVIIEKLVVEAGATFNASCAMKGIGAVKELNSSNDQEKQSEKIA